MPALIPITVLPVKVPPVILVVPGCGKYNAAPFGAEIVPPFTLIIVFWVKLLPLPLIPYPSSVTVILAEVLICALSQIVIP